MATYHVLLERYRIFPHRTPQDEYEELRRVDFSRLLDLRGLLRSACIHSNLAYFPLNQIAIIPQAYLAAVPWPSLDSHVALHGQVMCSYLNQELLHQDQQPEAVSQVPTMRTVSVPRYIAVSTLPVGKSLARG